MTPGSCFLTAPLLPRNPNNHRRHTMPTAPLWTTLSISIRSPVVSRPVFTASSNGKASTEHLPPLVDQLLNTPGLEAPEGSSPQQMLKVTEAFWKAMKDPKVASKPGPIVVTESSERFLHDNQSIDFDICVVGGTLGVLLALALQRLGHRVCIVERRLLQGRSQEWNISEKELESLVEAGLLTQQELQECIDTAWEADRVGFYSGESDSNTGKNNSNELWVKDVLNIGVSPRKLIATLKDKFIESGGVLQEHTVFKSAVVYQDCALVKLMPCGNDSRNGSGSNGTAGLELTPADVNRPCAVISPSNIDSGTASTGSSTATSTGSCTNELSCRILIDCMGHYSPIVKQIRNGQQPDGMVVVVGGCFTSNPTRLTKKEETAKDPIAFPNTADLLYSFTDSFNDSQLFWEAFPAEGGSARTAYMFLYSDTHPDRPTFTSLLNTYLELLPRYQNVSLTDIAFKRVLFGGFPCYMRGSPLKPAFNRVLQVGDAAATQSPLSFGGFGAMVRHLPRLTRGIDQALTENKLRKGDLGWLQPYQPSLSVAWLFQRSMSLRVGQLRREAERDITKDKKDSGSSKKTIKKKANKGWIPANHINRLLRCNFSVMRVFGDRVLRPFLQDSLQAGPLALTMLGMMLRNPLTVTLVLFQIGPMLILNWFRHFISLLVASALFILLKPLKTVVKYYTFQRLLDALEYGTAFDYEYRASSPVTEEDIAGTQTTGKLKEKKAVRDGSSDGGDVKAEEVEQRLWPAAVTN
jgi:lycopene cyclase CruP